jgi:hypothetical protein
MFVYYCKITGRDNRKVIGRGCTNKRVLAKNTSIGYDNLVRIFTREGRGFYENDDYIIVKIYPSEIDKGSQSFIRKGKGGMEKFVERYVIKGNNGY